MVGDRRWLERQLTLSFGNSLFQSIRLMIPAHDLDIISKAIRVLIITEISSFIVNSSGAIAGKVL